MKKNPFIIPIILITIFIIFADYTPTFAVNKSNKQIVKEYCNKYYKGYKIEYFTKWNEKKMSHRTDKKVVYVEISRSISSGKKDSRNNKYWGYIKGQHFYKNWYNTKVKKGKTVTQYCIYNPYTNYCDDVVAVVDNHKIR